PSHPRVLQETTKNCATGAVWACAPPAVSLNLLHICAHQDPQVYSTTHLSSSTAKLAFAQYCSVLYRKQEQVRSTEAWAKAANMEWTRKIRPYLKPLSNMGQRIL